MGQCAVCRAAKEGGTGRVGKVNRTRYAESVVRGKLSPLEGGYCKTR